TTGYHETNFSMAYSSHISWQNATSPVPMEVYPSLAFDSLFDNRGSRRNKSVLDRVQEHAAALRRQISGSDQAKLDEYLTTVREGEGTVLDNSCLLYLPNRWSGSKHDSTKLPLLLVGGLGQTIETGRVLDYVDAADDNRKLCSLYLSIMDRMGVKLDRFGDAD